MAGSAAHLVDRVLPSVPLRQYVLAFPYELSGLAARPEVRTRCTRPRPSDDDVGRACSRA